MVGIVTAAVIAIGIAMAGWEEEGEVAEELNAATGLVVGIHLRVSMIRMAVEVVVAVLAEGSGRTDTGDICPSVEVPGDVQHMMEAKVQAEDLDQLEILVGVVAVHCAVHSGASAGHFGVGGTAGALVVVVVVVVAAGEALCAAGEGDEQRHCVSVSQSAEVSV